MNSLAPAALSASILDDVLGFRGLSEGVGAPDSASDPAPTTIPSPRPRARLRAVLALIGSGLGGLLAGIDVLLLVLLETLLRGTAVDDIDVPGMGFAAWSAENGLDYGFGPAAAAILIASTAAGLAIGWIFVRSGRAKSLTSSRA